MTLQESNITPTPTPTPVPPAIKKDSTLAIISLVAGLLGWTFLPVVGAITAIVTGHIAKKEIRESNNQLSGDGMALAGLILGYVQIGVIVLVIIFGLAVIPAVSQIRTY